MAMHLHDDDAITAIADAIRLKTDSVAEMLVEDMPLAISMIESSGGAGDNVIDRMRLYIRIDDGDWIPFVKSDNWDAAVNNGKVGYNANQVKNLSGAVISPNAIGNALTMVTFANLVVPAFYSGNGSYPSGFRPFFALGKEPNNYGYWSAGLTKSASITIRQSMGFEITETWMEYTKITFNATESATINAISLNMISNSGADGTFQLGHFLLPTPIPVVSGGYFKLGYKIVFN